MNKHDNGSPIIIHVSVEAAPYSKKGGLGDVVGSLPLYLADYTKIKNIVIAPYSTCIKKPLKKYFTTTINFNGIDYEYTVLQGKEKTGNTKYYFIQVEDAFSMDDIYIDGNKPYLTDIGLQFFIFGKCVVDFIVKQKMSIKSLMTHDWHVAGIYAYIKNIIKFKEINTIHIIHNYHHQGEFFPDLFVYLEKELAEELQAIYQRTKYINLSLLALCNAKKVITVSPNYAKELAAKQVPHNGLHLFSVRDKDSISGILNGINDKLWNPKSNKFIRYKYNSHNIERKFFNKKFILNKLGLKNFNLPTILFLSRLTSQKGIDFFVDLKSCSKFDIGARMKKLMEKNINFVICGIPAGGLTGSINNQLLFLQEQFKENFRYLNIYTDHLAHELLAGSDFLLQPSRYEPCGLIQMYAYKFGTIPIVTMTGGFKDTVIDIGENKKDGTGFYITDFSIEKILEAVDRALDLYYDEKEFKQVKGRCMNLDNSWENRMPKYVELIG